MEPWKYKSATDIELDQLTRLKSERREAGLVSSLSHAAWLAFLRSYFFAYHRMSVRGREHLPSKPPFVLIANHASHLDALILAACLSRRVGGCVHPIAAGDVFFETPLVSAFAAMAINALPMWRKKVGRHALDDLKARLHAGECGYILFPEGARTRDGSALKWKAGIGMMVAGTQIPVIPCRIDGAFDALRPESTLPRPVKIRVEVFPAMQFAQEPNAREGWDRIAAALKERVVGGQTPSEPQGE